MRLVSRKTGLTALHIAAFFGETDAVRDLLTHIPAQSASDLPSTPALGIAKEDVAIISLHQQPLAWAVRDGVSLKVTPDNKPRLWYATISD